MAQKFTKQTLRVVAGQICQTIGWGAINSSAMDILVDVLHRYLNEIARTTHLFADQFGRTQPNLDDLGLAFSDMGIEVRELREYVEFVESVPCNLAVPKYPIPKENHLNFLKPGSKEVVTRPVHVHEHLPPTIELAVDTLGDAVGSPQPSPTFKRPGDPVDGAAKRARMGLEEEGRPLREISSVMMTTGGFISQAREGKLPESRIAVPANDIRPLSPPPQRYPSVPPEINREKKKKVVEGREKEKKKKSSSGDGSVRKLASMKEVAKLKAFKPPKPHTSHSPHHPPTPEKSLIQKLAESPHLVVTPVPSEPAVKLSTEPDKQKLNIFKKISKVKEEEPLPVKEIEPTFSSPGSPSTPKTPEILRSPEHKKKKKDKDKEKRRKNRDGERIKHDFQEADCRPKTPEVVEPAVLPPPPLFPFFPPGLVPPPISNPLIPRFPMPMGPNFPNLPMPPPHFMNPIPPPPKLEIPNEFLPTSSKSPLAILLDEKKIKEHKKDKKDKKKKDRKDKPKKDKKEKHRDEEKHKSKDKKEKKEKRKEREKEEERVKEKEREKIKEESSVPKLTLKLGPSSPRPPSPKKIEEFEERHPVPKPSSSSETSDIARISSLFSKPPKIEQKPLHIQTDCLKTPKDSPLQKSPGTIIDKDGNKVV